MDQAKQDAVKAESESEAVTLIKYNIKESKRKVEALQKKCIQYGAEQLQALGETNSQLAKAEEEMTRLRLQGENASEAIQLQLAEKNKEVEKLKLQVKNKLDEMNDKLAKAEEELMQLESIVQDQLAGVPDQSEQMYPQLPDESKEVEFPQQEVRIMHKELAEREEELEFHQQEKRRMHKELAEREEELEQLKLQHQQELEKISKKKEFSERLSTYSSNIAMLFNVLDRGNDNSREGKQLLKEVTEIFRDQFKIDNELLMTKQEQQISALMKECGVDPQQGKAEDVGCALLEASQDPFSAQQVQEEDLSSQLGMLKK